MLLQKEKLGKAVGRHESSFTDDGFALGLAYILRILDQNDLFNSLHWFESVNNHIGLRRNEGQQLRQNLQNAKSSGKSNTSASKANEEELLQHQVTMKKLSNVQMEFDLFFYSFSGATIFFQDITTPTDATGVDGTKEEKKEEAPAAAAPAAEANGVPPAPDMSIPAPPPLDNGFVVAASAPPPPPMAPPMAPAMDGMVIGVGAPPPPPPDF